MCVRARAIVFLIHRGIYFTLIEACGESNFQIISMARNPMAIGVLTETLSIGKRISMPHDAAEGRKRT